MRMEAFDNVADDCVMYSIFLAESGSESASNPDSNQERRDRERKRLDQIRVEAASLAATWTESYIWNRQPFLLRMAEKFQKPCLVGTTEFGDCIDDEWFIVFILRSISSKFRELQIQITDNDGEFLLIQAAEALPRWLNPDNAENRVWMIGGVLHIISPNAADPDESEIQPLSLFAALDVLNSDTSDSRMLHSDDLQTEAFAHITEYPETARRNIHRARVQVPFRIAQLLHLYPEYITAACESFMLRDPLSMRVCTKMANFPPDQPGSMVTCTVKMTRLTYAQMTGQKIAAPPKFVLPAIIPNDPDSLASRADAELGMKITCGFELLCAGAGNSEKHKLRKRDLASDQRYKAFIESLRREGYFAKARPRTKKYAVLVEEAQKSYLQICGDEYDTSLIGKDVILRIQQIATHTPELSTKQIDDWAREVPDSDEWLNVDLEELSEKYRLDTEPQAGSDEQEFDELKSKAQGLFEKLNSFVNDRQSGLGGLEFDDDVVSSDESSIEDDDVDEDEFLEFFLKEALNLSPEEIEQFRADPIPIPDPLSNKSNQSRRKKSNSNSNSTSKSQSTMEQVSSTSRISEVTADYDDDDSENEEPVSFMPSQLLNSSPEEQMQVLKNLFESISSQGSASGPASNLIERILGNLQNLDGA
ncbi:SGT1 protein-domain-containing protein [Lipomyces oligophaga]|uniref:SGT1 protein-domain-containing protein n=1 Tax=Lipomyces oligophaga TaxID=45792 RepID=UPI0034CF8E1F